MMSCRRLLLVVVLVCTSLVGVDAEPAFAEVEWTLNGRVVGPSGDGAAGCSVVVRSVFAEGDEGRSEAASWRTTTASDGRFTLTLDGPNLVEAVVGPRSGDLSSRGSSSSGRVDSDRLRCRSEQRLGPLPVVRSITLPSLVLGALDRADELDAAVDVLGHRALRWRSGTVTRPAAPPRRSIHGRVVDARDGRPIDGALVWSGGDLGEASRSAADGRFTVEVAEGVDRLDIAAVGRLWRRVEMPSASHAVDLSISLEATVGGAGEVRDLDDRPIAGATVRLVSRSVAPALLDARLGLVDEPHHVRTDTAGRFVVDDLPPGWLDLTASADGFAPFDVLGVELASPSAPETLADLGVLVLDRGAVWHGRLVDGDGVALVGVPARYRQVGVESAWSDAIGGRIDLDGLTVGRRLDLEVRAAGYRPVVVAVWPALDDRMQTIALTPMRAVHGQVVDASGSAIAARVEVIGGDLAGGPRVVETAPDGRFEIAAAGGRLALTASRPGHGRAEPVIVRLGPEDEPVDEVRLRLRAELVLEGRVVGPNGDPLADVALVAEQIASDGSELAIPVASSTSGADGSFRFVGLADGGIRVAAEHPDFGSVERVVGLDRDFDRDNDLDRSIDSAERSIELVYPPGWPLSGRVIDRLGRPVSSARLRLRSPTHGVRSARVDAAGTFTFRSVATGAYRMEIDAEGFATPPPRIIEIEDRPPAHVDVLVETGATVWAQVLGLELEELAGVEVEARARHGATRSARPDHRGRARLGPLVAGEWTLTALADDGRRRAVAVVDVAAGEAVGRPIVADLAFGRGVALTGRIDHRQQPVAGARLLLLPDRGASIATATDTDGRFALHGLPQGVYRMEITSSALDARTVRAIELTVDRHVAIELGAVD